MYVVVMIIYIYIIYIYIIILYIYIYIKQQFVIWLVIELLKSSESPKNLNSSHKVSNKTENIRLDREILRERYIFPGKRHQIVGDVRYLVLDH